MFVFGHDRSGELRVASARWFEPPPDETPPTMFARCETALQVLSACLRVILKWCRVEILILHIDRTAETVLMETVSCRRIHREIRQTGARQ
jgi:hypothetical protein